MPSRRACLLVSAVVLGLAAAGGAPDFDRLLSEGRELAAAGRFEEAIGKFREARKLKPDDQKAADLLISTHLSLAQKQIAQREVAAAERTLETLLGLSPDNAEAKQALKRIRTLRSQVDRILEQAELFFDIGAYGSAIADYQRVLALAPERAAEIRDPLAQAHAEQGNAFFVQRRYPDAAVNFLAATRLAQETDTPTTAPGSRPKSRLDYREVRKRWAYAVLVPVIDAINAGAVKDAAGWEGARATAERVADVAPDVPHVFFVLGLCREALGDPAGASAAYAKVTGEGAVRNPTREQAKAARDRAHEVLRRDPVRMVVATKDERWLSTAPGDWQTLTTDHFVIFHRNEFLARKAARAAEYWYNAVVVHWTAPGTYRPWSVKCSLYLYPTAEAFSTASRQPGWVPALSQVIARDGKLVAHRILTYQTVRLLNESVLPHEMTHVVLPELLGYPAEFPRWIQEAAALQEEPEYKRYQYRRLVRDALEDGVALSIERIMAVTENPKEEEAERYYAQCHAIGEFLLARGGRTRFLEFCRSAVKDGADRALLATYGFKTLSEFDQAWREGAT